jgi:hypothetical protein
MVARRRFTVPKGTRATLSITADTVYRLAVNGRWIGDGPCRAWPQHYQYDVLDLTAYLQEGDNELHVTAWYYGVGTFHQVPQRPGLLADLALHFPDGTGERLGTDTQWQAAPCPAWLSNVPKISIQMGPLEIYDARLAEPLAWGPAIVVAEAESGPWRDLHPRDVALLTRLPVAPRRYLGAQVVSDGPWVALCTNLATLVHPQLTEATHLTGVPGVFATWLVSDRPRSVRLHLDGLRATVNGHAGEAGVYPLVAGDNLLLAAPPTLFGHCRSHGVVIEEPAGLTLRHPRDPEQDTPWCLLHLPRFAKLVAQDWQIDLRGGHPWAAQAKTCVRVMAEVLARGADPAAWLARYGRRLTTLPSEALLHDSFPDFVHARPLRPATPLVTAPEAAMHDHAEVTIVHPAPDGAVQLCYDLGEQVVGYWAFELVAEAGVTVDLTAVEYLTESGRRQDTGGHRNVLRYVTHAGVNRFVSAKRRSGRYLYLTLRHQRTPVRLRLLHVIESTYPVAWQGRFSCSDTRLDRIWQIAARTLQLCMEDTFVDCPLYEQTLWIGDARNEALFAYTACGAYDLARRCIRLGGQSLERYPLVGCQVPSSWDAILPAWSFLWGIGVWDYYAHTGDREFLAEAWPWVRQNLRGTAQYLTPDGLFSGPFWNMFDWSGADQDHNTVLHNSMLAVGAIDAARHCAAVLEDAAAETELAALRQRLAQAIEARWQPARGAYPDSIHEDGTVSPSICQHTSALAYLYDLAPAARHASLVEHLIHPPAGMVQVGSPFAIQYFYEALEKAGRDDAILASLYHHYLPMLEAGATTVWETFPASPTNHDFPTRSHCHAWSSAPLYFLNRGVLGIRLATPGGRDYVISPRLGDLTWAKGASATPCGPLEVAWRRHGETLSITVHAPPGVTWRYEPHASHQGLTVQLTPPATT